MMHYKNTRDPDFIFAAQMSKMSLQECVAWCNYVLKKAAADPEYKMLLSMCGDFDYDRSQARGYLEDQDRCIDLLEHPDKPVSTADARHKARQSIAQVRSWAAEWDKGENFRDKIYGDEIAPSDYYAMEYTSPSVIPTISVPGDFDPWYDGFADNC